MKFLLLLSSFCLFTLASAQNGFQAHVVFDNALGAKSVYAGDLDGDGDQDIVSASSIDGIIAWYENLDGQGNFGEPDSLIIGLEGNGDLKFEDEGARFVTIVDLDNDNDLDILVATVYGHQVLWLEKL